MPIYEYRCENCNQYISIFTQGFKGSSDLKCPRCGSEDLTRLFSSFSIGKGESYYRKGVYEEIMSASNLTRGLMANDPQSLAEWNRRMSRAAGEEGTPEGEEIQGRLKAGESVDKVAREAQSTMKLEEG